MKKSLYTLVAVLLILTGCSAQSSSVDKKATNTNTAAVNQEIEPIQPQDEVKQQITMPEQMPDDFDFMVSYGYGDVNKNVIDTYSGTVTKDLIAKGTATADLTFTSDELNEIYSKMKAIAIMAEKQLTSESNCAQVPYSTDTWKVTVDGHTTSFTWTDKACTTTKDARQLLQLRQDVQHIVALKESYKALPAAVGGYD